VHNMMKKKGQVWVETVIYVLIGLALISLVLSFVMPRINQQRDKIIVDQTVVSLSKFDRKINEVINGGRDNKRIVDFSMKQGSFYINSEENEIVFVLEGLSKPYSEPGIEIPVGRVNVETTEGRKTSSVNLTLEYFGVNLVYDDVEQNKKFTPSSTPYRFSIENNGAINIKQIS
jgi:type II secretory pathway pseudopilin PulG